MRNHPIESEHQRPLRIAVVGGRGIPSHYSGVERIWEELYPGLARRGHSVTVYCRPGVAGGTASHRGVRLVTTNAPGPDSAQTLSHTRSALLHAARFGDAGEPFDLVALHALPPQWFVPFAKRMGLTVVSHVHGLDWQRAKWQRTPLGIGSRIIRAGERRMVRSADAISVCAENLRDYYRGTYGREVDVLPNGVVPDDSPITPDADVLAKHGLRAGHYVASVGRIVPEKRVHDSIKAFLQLPDRRQHDGLKLAIIGTGGGDYLKQVQRLAATSDGRVVLLGQREGLELEHLFRGARAYITSSELEGLPSSVCEAMERSLPVVSSKIPPHQQLLSSTRHLDLHFDVGDTHAAAERLHRVLGDCGLASNVASLQKRHVREHHAWPVLVDQFEALYQRVATRARVATQRRAG